MNGVFPGARKTHAERLTKVVFRGILKTVSKLTAEMPMRYAWQDACRKHHRSVETNDAWWRPLTQAPGPTRMPAFFLRNNIVNLPFCFALISLVTGRLGLARHLGLSHSPHSPLCPKGLTRLIFPIYPTAARKRYNSQIHRIPSSRLVATIRAPWRLFFPIFLVAGMSFHFPLTGGRGDERRGRGSRDRG